MGAGVDDRDRCEPWMHILRDGAPDSLPELISLTTLGYHMSSTEIRLRDLIEPLSDPGALPLDDDSRVCSICGLFRMHHAHLESRISV